MRVRILGFPAVTGPTETAVSITLPTAESSAAAILSMTHIFAGEWYKAVGRVEQVPHPRAGCIEVDDGWGLQFVKTRL